MELFLSAADHSGDNAASRLLESLRKIRSDIVTFGLGQEKLQRQGQEQLAAGDRLRVLGFWEVAKRYGFFRRLMYTCLAEIERRKPQAVVLVDYPGFNLRLARLVKKLDIPVIYYISPQIWAWGRNRVRAIREDVDLMLLILAFEEEFYRDTGVNAQFVGHYLVEDIPDEYIASPPPQRQTRRLCLLPGSRPQEVERMLPAMLQTAVICGTKLGLESVVAGVTGVFDYESVLRQYPAGAVDIVYDDSRRCVYESDVVVTASGTATLETGIIGRPMVVIYRTGFLTYQIARRLINLDKIALVNLVAGKSIVPELIQHEATPTNMVKEIDKFVNDSDYYRVTRAQLNRIPSMLGGAGASDRAAHRIMQFLDQN